MRLSIAVIAMSNLPSIRWVSWNTELGVGVTFTSMPFFANRPFSCATQTGQLKPPGKTMTLTVWGAGGCAAHPVNSRTMKNFRKLRMNPPREYDTNARRKCDERLERYSKLEPRRDDEARRALQGPEGLRRRAARQPAARVPAQALRSDRLPAAHDRQRGNHLPGRRRRLGDAGDRHRRGLQPRLLQGEAGQGPADAQPRYQRDLHPDHRQVALPVERGPGNAARRPQPPRRDLAPGRRCAPLHERDLRRAWQGARPDVHHRRQPAAGRVHAARDAALRTVFQRTTTTKSVATASATAATSFHGIEGWLCA